MDKLILTCLEDLSYALSQEGQDWRKEFLTMHHALDHARRMITEDTALTVYSSRGRVLVESVLPPRAPRPIREIRPAARSD